MVKRNILANVLGGIWATLLNLAAIPLQLRILGAEAYGLIGFIAALQVILIILDFGLATTIIREVAADTSPERQHSRDLIQTSATVYWLIAALLAGIFMLLAEPMARGWFKPEALSTPYIATALQIMALYVMFNWPLGIYVSVISGLQRLDWVNVLKVITITSAQGGGIVVLLITRDLHAFLIWLMLNALASVIIHALICRRLLPGLPLGLRIVLPVIRRVWKLSLDLNLISTLAVIYTQADRLLISNLLPLRLLGYYNAATTVTRQISNIQGYVNSAVLPALTQDYSQGTNLLATRYMKYAQGLVYLIGLPAFVLVFWGYDILRVWTTPEIASGAFVATAILSLGSLLNAAMSACYTLVVATGQTRIPLWVNVAGIFVYVPGLYLLIHTWDIQGAALAWLLLNVYYTFSLLPMSQRRVFQAGMFGWLRQNLIPFLLCGALIFGLGRLAIEVGQWQESLWIWLILALCCLVYLLVGFALLRADLQATLRRMATSLVLRLRHMPSSTSEA